MNDIFVSEDQLDFHDFERLTPFDIEKILNEFIEDSYVAGRENILIITGKGKVVRPLVEKLLPKNKHIRKFKRAGYFNGQDGAFEIFLNN